MKSPDTKKNLSFRPLVDFFRKQRKKAKNYRGTNSIEHGIADTWLSGLATMHFQDSSLLESQRRLETKQGRSNLKTLFGVSKIPSDNQMREILDCVPSSCPSQRKVY